MRFLFLIHGEGEVEAALGADERGAIVEEHMTYVPRGAAVEVLPCVEL